MDKTINLQLDKPSRDDYISVKNFSDNMDKIDTLGAPEFDDSGSVTSITDFPTYLNTLVSKSSIFTFFRNLKAGLGYVLHVGMLVNNTLTNNDNLPAAASAVYKLQESLNEVNSNLRVINLLNGTTEIVDAWQELRFNTPLKNGDNIVILSSTDNTNHYSSFVSIKANIMLLNIGDYILRFQPLSDYTRFNVRFTGNTPLNIYQIFKLPFNLYNT